MVFGQNKPNIVLIIIDDMGWKDMGCSGSQYYETPNIDALAKAGIRFENGYSTSPVCAPSRGAIYTGKSPGRTKFTTVFDGEASPDDRLYKESKQRDGGAKNQNYEALHRHNVPKSEVFFAEELKNSGYATGHFGKWHCGIHQDYTPNKRGFQVAIGYRSKHVPTGISGHWGKTFKPYGVGLQDLKDDKYVADALTDECIDFIRNNQNKPFIAVLSHYLVHNPIQAKPELVERFRNKATTDQDNPEYAAMLASVDESLGRLVSELKKLRIEKNTLVIFTSDNGGLNSNTSNYPLLGGKSYAFEAAMRVPFIVKWPAVVKPGQTTKERAIGTDFYPTFLDIAGIDLKPEQQIDGRSLLPVLEGKQSKNKRRLLFHYPHYTSNTSPYSTIIDGDYKLIHFYNEEAGAYLLFDLNKDPEEQNNLSDEKPEVTKQLAQLLEIELTKMGAELPTLNPNFQPNDPNLSNRKTNYEKANKDREIQKNKIGNFKNKSVAE
jgi:arylsulfatase A-like enzyme